MSLVKTSLALCAATAVAATAAFAASHTSAGDKTVAARHAQMSMIAYHTGMLGSIAKGEMAFDQAMVDAAATNIRELAKLDRTTLWIAGTEQGAVEGSRAKAEIWQDAAGFADAFTQLENAAGAIVGASDAAAVGAGMGALGGSCKNCHEKFRGPET